MSRPDITVALLAHAEGPLIGVSLHSLLDAAGSAAEAGADVELLVVLRRPDRATSVALADAGSHGVRVVLSDAADDGEARAEAAAAARGRYVSVLEGGNLFSLNWLSAAYAVCESDPGRVVAHPEVSWLFDGDTEIFFGADETDAEFDSRLLRVEDPWDSLSMAPAGLDVELGEGDPWLRHRAGLGAVVRRVAPDTLHFVRHPTGGPEADRPPPVRFTSEFLGSGWAPSVG